MVLAAGDEGVVGGELPVFAGDVLEVNGGAGEGVEAPEALDGAGDGVGAGSRGVGLGRGVRRVVAGWARGLVTSASVSSGRGLRSGVWARTRPP